MNNPFPRLAMVIVTLVSVHVLSQEQKSTFHLQELINYALENSPELHKLQIDLDTQEQSTIVARASFDPELDYTGSHLVDDNQTNNTLTLTKQFQRGLSLSTSTGITSDSGSGDDSTDFSITLSKKLIGSGSTLEDTRKAIDDSLIEEIVARNEVNRRKRRLVSDISSAFYQTINDIQSKTIQERRLERAKKNLEMAIEREKPLDIITAEIQIPENELAVVQVERAIKNDLDSLKVLIGMPVEESLTISDEFTFKIQETDVEKDTQYALEHHEDFLNLGLRRKQIERDCRVAKSELWPDLELKATNSLESEPNDYNPGGGSSEQTITLSLAWELGRRADKAKYRQAFNRLRRNEREHFILKQNKVTSLDALHRQLQEKAKSIELQQRRVDLVTRQVELYRDRYENGEIDILEFIRSQNDLENSKVDLIKLQTDYMGLLTTYNFQAGR